MVWDPSYTAKLQWTGIPPTPEELEGMIATLAREEFKSYHADCDCGHCGEAPAEQNLRAIEAMICDDARRAWTQALFLLVGEKAKTRYTRRFSSLDAWIKNYPRLSFMIEYHPVDGADSYGTREWYAEGRVTARQEGWPQIVWGKRAMVAE